MFCEKPLAETVEEAQSIVDAARRHNRKLVIGYILRVHPAWVKFIELARTLGKPLVMRMNLNQQSHGPAWTTHRTLMNSMSPIVDCGVHYVDVMCQMTGAKPLQVSAIGARLSDELKPGMYNYGQLQVTFDDGSVGWYEAGWGPMMSEMAFFVKDVVGPKGCVSIVKDPNEAEAAASDDIDSHTKTNCIRLHHSALDGAQRIRQARRVHQHRGRARSPGAVRSRAGVPPARDPGGRRPVGPHARRRQQPAHRAGGGRERADGADRGAVDLPRRDDVSCSLRASGTTQRSSTSLASRR